MEKSSTSPSFLPGSVGPFVDELPLVTHANVRPYVIAILLHRGAVKFQEIIGCLTPHCPQIDLKVGAWDAIENCDIEDKTRLELITEEVLGEMIAEGILRYNEEQELWVLQAGGNRRHLPKIVNWVSATAGQLPHHLLLDLSTEHEPGL